ncbi:unnamed protein product [Acanthoscelides obtectus]|uniref:C2H2-type domain-containing protein n=1 Tax=Acanthoscelides obtectus TaxID=200917 RepID=A0A9P0NS22_ACAOB|nr:unnamed protein product [Acanthoscelides obtectus]CAK1661481.1 Zinc finger protein 354B [Acanthoscelides obtectus]
MEEKCRTCAEHSTKMYHMNDKIGAYDRTIREMVLTLVPELKGRLQDTDVVCILCRRLLHQCLKFIEKCFQSDEILLSASKVMKQTDSFKKQVDGGFKKDQHKTVADIDSLDNVKYNEIFDKTYQDESIGNVNDKSLRKTNAAQKNVSTTVNNILAVEKQLEKLFAEESDELSDHDYSKGEYLAINKLDAPPSSIVGAHNRILSVNLPKNGPELFIASLATIDVNVFGCSLNTEPSFENKRILLVGDYGDGVKCEFCEKIFISQEYLEKHTVRHEEEKQAMERRNQLRKRKRELGRQRFKKQQEERKKNMVMKSRKTSYMCEQCGKTFTQHATYYGHKKTHKDMTYICHICGMILKRAGSLRVHVSVVHGEKKYRCTLCPKVFRAELYLKKHISVSHMKLHRVHCEECGKTCGSVSALKCHRAVVHRKEVKCFCPICGLGLYRNDYLKRHMRRHMEAGKEGNDTGERKKTDWKEPIPCKICGKVVVRQNMYNHLKNHRAERKFKCSVCGMTFKFKNNAERHERLHQKDSGKFKCHVCWKSFKDQSDYDEHMTHHNKTYTCPVCNEGFGRKFALKSHLYDVHPEVATSLLDTFDLRRPYKKRYQRNTENMLVKEEEEPGEYVPEHDQTVDGTDDPLQNVNNDEDSAEVYEYLENEEHADNVNFDSTFQGVADSEDRLSMEEQYLEPAYEEEGEETRAVKLLIAGDENHIENEEVVEGTFEEYVIENENGERYIVKNGQYLEEEGEVC